MKARLLAACFLPAALMVAAASSASADPVGPYPNSVSVGGLYEFFTGVSDPLTGPLTPPNLTAKGENVGTAVFIYSRYFTKELSVDVILGYPPTLRIKGSDAAAPLGTLAKATDWSPAIQLNYHFPPFPGDMVTPYVGVGIAYTSLSNITPSPGLSAVFGGPTTASVNSPVSFVGTVGGDINITERFFTTVSASYLPLKLDAKLTTGPIERTTTINLNPVVVRATLGYRF